MGVVYATVPLPSAAIQPRSIFITASVPSQLYLFRSVGFAPLQAATHSRVGQVVTVVSRVPR